MTTAANVPPARAWFAGRTAVIGTMHGKERVIAPPLERELGLVVSVTRHVDTDRFGAFTGEVARAGTQIEAARAKALAALDETGAEIGIASEGSFGPHPASPFLPGNLELVLLIDRARGIELVGKHLTTEVLHQHEVVRGVEDALAFADRADFPRHALIAKPAENGASVAPVKGIADRAALVETVERLVRAAAAVHLETDLRAHCNPTRMRAIAAATADLVQAALRGCPACATPGFAVVDRRIGLPCEWCGLPTGQTAALVLGCVRCEHREERPREDGRTHADPATCPACNP